MDQRKLSRAADSVLDERIAQNKKSVIMGYGTER
jgi:hypothetical protein